MIRRLFGCSPRHAAAVLALAVGGAALAQEVVPQVSLLPGEAHADLAHQLVSTGSIGGTLVGAVLLYGGRQAFDLLGRLVAVAERMMAWLERGQRITVTMQRDDEGTP